VAGLTLLLGILVLLATRTRPAGRLVFQAGPRAGEGVALLRQRTRLGALEDNDLCIPSETVSKYHAVIYRKGRQIEIEDLNSTNGTFVNGTAIRRSPLQPGDRIRLADVDLLFER
jgi:pSer/pThr/pTyr-binding forkhead associated (FHA) protein